MQAFASPHATGGMRLPQFEYRLRGSRGRISHCCAATLHAFAAARDDPATVCGPAAPSRVTSASVGHALPHAIQAEPGQERGGITRPSPKATAMPSEAVPAGHELLILGELVPALPVERVDLRQRCRWPAVVAARLELEPPHGDDRARAIAREIERE